MTLFAFGKVSPVRTAQEQCRALVAAAVITLVLAACSVGASGSPRAEIAIPTGRAFVGTPGPCPAALITGRLVRDTESGLVLEASNARRVRLIFPFGYSAVADGERVMLV